MAVIYFDFKLSIGSPKVTEGLPGSDRTKLFGKSKVSTRKAAQPLNLSPQALGPSGIPQEPRLPARQRLEKLSEGYRAIEQAIDGTLEKLTARTEDLIYEFDPDERPDLAEALGGVFKGSNNRITYKMYVAALKLDKEISLQIGEALADGL